MIQTIFQTSIYKTKLVNQKLTNDIYNLLKTSEFREESNIGGKQTTKFDALVNKELSQAVLQETAKYIDHFNKLKNFKITINGFWINTNDKYHYNKEHMHFNTENKLSGIWYVNCNADSGNIIFRGREELIAPSQLNTYFKSSHFLNVFEMTPEKNDLLIFPSYLVHSVSPNISDLTRVSVAFDIGFIDV